MMYVIGLILFSPIIVCIIGAFAKVLTLRIITYDGEDTHH